MGRSVGQATEKKWIELFKRLKHATEKKTIAWKETSDDDTFLTSLGVAVIVFGRRDVRGPIDYFFRVENQDGEVIDEFTDADIDGEDPDGGPYFRAFRAFHQDMKRHISGADAFLDKILENLPDPDEEIPF